ncbi:molecular chaperone Skp [Candidatus Nitromaritima sp. SCGC AAA799-A02]|nr:molecular chaperone Skp [Candidatus Nitromaritima sp. SCGC AAA799-A02]
MFNGVYRLRFLPTLFSFALGFFLLAQATPGYGKEIRVGVIDIQKAVSGTKDWKKEFLSFKLRFKKEKERIAKREENLKAMIQDLNKQGFVLNPELKKKKEDNVRKKKREFERYVQDKNEEFSKKEKEITGKILKKMVNVIKKIGDEKKFTMILEKKVGLYFDNSVDLTTLATKTYDRMN